MHLADLGAEVIKIEDPASRGDVGRYVPPFQEGDTSLFFETYNRNKKSLSLDIGSEAGRRVFHDLVAQSDAVFSNLRGDVPERLGLLYEQLEPFNPQIVCCSLTGFGMTGPRAAEPGYDYILQGLAGWMSLTGEPDGPPTKSGLSLVDFSGGFVAASAILAGIHAARRDGRGMDCDLSLYDTAISLLGYMGTWHLTGGFEPQRVMNSGHPSLVPFQAFESADGWLVIGCAKEKFWQRLTAVIGHPELAADPRFVDFAARQENKDELIGIIQTELKRRPAVEWLEDLRVAGVPSSPILSVPEALADPHTIARELIVETAHPSYGTVRQPVSPIRLRTHQPDAVRAPTLTEHAPEILSDLLGYVAEIYEHLSAAGAFGSTTPESPTT
jgi:crotonobetainyl-CoA:carnitine CoA-transferase CaiB-like acyl-CoA transferase